MPPPFRSVSTLILVRKSRSSSTRRSALKKWERLKLSFFEHSIRPSHAGAFISSGIAEACASTTGWPAPRSLRGRLSNYFFVKVFRIPTPLKSFSSVSEYCSKSFFSTFFCASKISKRYVYRMTWSSSGSAYCVPPMYFSG